MAFPQTPIVLDTFTDTNTTLLEHHTSDTGHTWEIATSGAMTGGSWAITNNELAPTSGQNGAYFISNGSFSTDVSIQVDTYQTNTTNVHSGLAQSITADFASGSYLPVSFQSAWSVFKAVGGAFNLLGSNPTVGSEWLTGNTFADGNVIRWCRRTVGGNAVLSLYCNGYQVWTYTDTSGVLNATLPGIYNDNGTGGADLPSDNFKVFSASQEIGLLMIGDSITAGYVYNGSTTQVAPYPNIWLGNALSKGKKGLPVFVSNYGYTATTSNDWVNGTNGANLTGGIASLSNQSIKVASIMLGVNDSKTATRVSIAQHTSNIASIIATLKAAGFVAIFLHMPTYTASGAFSNTWDNLAAIQYMPAYREAQLALVDNQTVFLGDTRGADMLAANVSGDGIHPTIQMSRILFQSHANAMFPVLNGLVKSAASTIVSAF